VEGDRGKNGQVVLVGTELFCFPGVWEGLGVQFRVAKQHFEFGVLEGAGDGGVDIILRWGGNGRANGWA